MIWKVFDLSIEKHVVTLHKDRQTVVRAGLLRKKSSSVLILLFLCLLASEDGESAVEYISMDFAHCLGHR